MTMNRAGLCIYAVLYAAISWGISKIVVVDFKWILLGLLSARLAYAALEFVVEMLAWRIAGRSRKVERILSVLIKDKFPKRVYRQDKFRNYLWRIKDGSDYKNGEVTPEIKEAAADLRKAITMVDMLEGSIGTIRTLDAAERALEIYSPCADAPIQTHGPWEPWRL